MPPPRYEGGAEGRGGEKMERNWRGFVSFLFLFTNAAVTTSQRGRVERERERGGREREREGGREGEGERQRQRDIDTERQKEREKKRERETRGLHAIALVRFSKVHKRASRAPIVASSCDAKLQRMTCHQCEYE